MQPTQPMRSYEHDCGELIPDVVNAFGLYRLDELANATRGLAGDAPRPERQAAYMTFLKHNLLKYTLYEQDGVVHLWSLVRSDDGRYALHAESNDHRFPYERHDLSEVEAWDYMAEPMRRSVRERLAIEDEADFPSEPSPERSPEPVDRHLYSPRQLAERWKCSVSHVRRLIRQGQVDAFRHGRRLLLVRGEVVQAYERSRLLEVVTAEEQAKRDAEVRRVQEAQNEMRLARRIERRTTGLE